MSGGGFLNQLMSFPKDTINEETVELLEPYLRMEDYSMASAKKVCGDVAGLAAWTRAMAIFYGINHEVLPLKVTCFEHYLMIILSIAHIIYRAILLKIVCLLIEAMQI